MSWKESQNQDGSADNSGEDSALNHARSLGSRLHHRPPFPGPHQ